MSTCCYSDKELTTGLIPAFYMLFPLPACGRTRAWAAPPSGASPAALASSGGRSGGRCAEVRVGIGRRLPMFMLFDVFDSFVLLILPAICIYIYTHRERERDYVFISLSLSIYIYIYTYIHMLYCFCRHPPNMCLAARFAGPTLRA